MTHYPLTKQGALETWLAGEIADLARTLPATEAGLLLLDAQITDLENKCAASENRKRPKLALALPQGGSPHLN